MGFKEWIIPQDRVFYDLLERDAQLAVDAVAAFHHMLDHWGALPAEREAIGAIEHEADTVSHTIFERLSRTFITPIDREDIARLAHVIDDVIDSVDGAANCIHLFEFKEVTPPMREFAAILTKQAALVRTAVQALRKPGTMGKAIPPIGIEIHRLENEADQVLNRAMAELFHGHDPIHVIKHKEVYELLEMATDRCEDVADVLQDILRKHG